MITFSLGKRLFTLLSLVCGLFTLPLGVTGRLCSVIVDCGTETTCMTYISKKYSILLRFIMMHGDLG